MAMYRIKPAAEELPPEQYPPAEYWRETSPEQERDLDFAEIAQLNRAAEQAGETPEELVPISPFRSPWFRALLALLAIVGLMLLVTADLLRTNIDFGFLSQSAQLKQDESLAALQAAVVTVECSGSSGSGFNIRADGLIVTNRHVVEGGGIITISFSGGERKVFTSRDYVALDEVDLALIDIDGEALPAVELHAAYPAADDAVVFIGNPLGFDWTISTGSVVGMVELDEVPIILFNGPVHPGSSGSPLFNADAEVIGVIFASLQDVENSGLAIPVAYLIKYLEEEHEQ